MAQREGGQSAGAHCGLSVPMVVAWPLVMAGVLALLAGAYFLGREGYSQRVLSAGPRVEDVRRIAKLAVLRVQVANVIQGDTAGATAVVLVKGDCDMAVDLDGIQIADKDERGRTAAVVIPSPRPDRPRVDQSRTRIYELRKTGWALINPFADPRQDLLESCMRAAQDEVEQAVQGAEYVARAQEQAELLLTAFYKELGWSVTVRWK